MIIAGIDPGISGAIALWDGVAISLHEMPTVNVAKKGKTRRKVVGRVLAQMIQHADHAFIEKAQSMPGQGVVSVFGYGEAFGMVKGICCAKNIPITEVHPKTWKKAMLADQDKTSKDASRYRAMQLWPDLGSFDRKKDQHVAEAALIAEYGRRQLATTTGKPGVNIEGGER